MDEFTELITEEEISPPTEEIVRNFATIGEVYDDGVSLIFDGEDTPTEKHYLCNSNVYFKSGDRARILADSGTYVVEYVVGAPRQEELRGVPDLDYASSGDVLSIYTLTGGYKNYHWWPPEKELPTGGTAGQVLTKTAGGLAWENGAVPSTGTTGFLLTKTASGYEWKPVPVELPSGGSTGQVLTKTSSGVTWDDAGGVPSTGTTGYVLTKTSTGYAWQAVPAELPSGGSTGQVLTKTASGAKWDDAGGVPSTGTTGYVLTKTSTGYAWQAVPAELPSGGTTGYVLTKTASGSSWQASTGVPSGGSTGQVLTKTATGSTWQAVPTPKSLSNSYNTTANYNIEIRSQSNYYATTPVFQIRMAGGSWKTITTT